MRSLLNRSKLIAALLLSGTFSLHADSNSVKSHTGLARVSVVKLSRAIRVNLDDESLVVVALEDCSIIIDGHPDALKAGSYKEYSRGGSVGLSPADSTSAQLALVHVLPHKQTLTILNNTLEVNQELEDASGRNQTLMIALNTLQFRDETNLAAAEDEPWKSSHPRTISLQRGGTAWLKKGKHRVRNTGAATARFITIEW